MERGLTKKSPIPATNTCGELEVGVRSLIVGVAQGRRTGGRRARTGVAAIVPLRERVEVEATNHNLVEDRGSLGLLVVPGALSSQKVKFPRLVGLAFIIERMSS